MAPTHGLGQELIEIPRVGLGGVGSGRVGSSRVRRFQILLGQVQSPLLDPTRLKPTGVV